MLRWQISAVCIGLSLAVTTAALPPNSELEVVTIAEMRQVTNDVTGEAIFVPAERLRVGDEIFYTVAVRNPTETELREVVVVRPVPANTRYVEESAVGPGCRVSFS